MTLILKLHYNCLLLFITEFFFFFYLDFDNMDVINVINLCNHKNLRTFGNMSLEHIDA